MRAIQIPKRGIIYLIILALHLGLGQATAAPSPLDLDDPKALEFAQMDYPKHYIPLLTAQLKNLNPETDSIHWVRAIWFLTLQHEYAEIDNIKKAAEIALRNNLHLEWADLSFALSTESEAKSSFDQTLHMQQSIIQQARSHGDPVHIAYCLAKHTVFLLDHNHVQEAMEHIQEA